MAQFLKTILVVAMESVEVLWHMSYGPNQPQTKKYKLVHFDITYRTHIDGMRG
jgi:hypothetical protein